MDSSAPNGCSVEDYALAALQARPPLKDFEREVVVVTLERLRAGMDASARAVADALSRGVGWTRVVMRKLAERGILPSAQRGSSRVLDAQPRANLSDGETKGSRVQHAPARANPSQDASTRFARNPRSAAREPQNGPAVNQFLSKNKPPTEVGNGNSDERSATTSLFDALSPSALRGQTQQLAVAAFSNAFKAVVGEQPPRARKDGIARWTAQVLRAGTEPDEIVRRARETGRRAGEEAKPQKHLDLEPDVWIPAPARANSEVVDMTPARAQLQRAMAILRVETEVAW